MPARGSAPRKLDAAFEWAWPGARADGFVDVLAGLNADWHATL